MLHSARLRTVVLAVLSLALAPAGVAWACNPQAYLTLDKATYSAGEQIQVSGAYFKANRQLTVRVGSGGAAGTVTTSSGGSFTTSVTAPVSAGSYTLSAIGYEPDGSVTPGLPARASFEVAGASPPPAGDRDCSDFPSQASAQDYFESRGGPSQDPDRLDSDGDGVACGSNPCPCRGLGQTPPPSSPAPPLPVPEPQGASVGAVIVRVIDGDTVVARTAQREVTVRLLGIDTPETKEPGTPVECGGRKATKVMRRFARVGERVTLTTDSTQDTFDRIGHLLAYVTGDNGRLLQVETLERGWAKVYVFDRRFTRYNRFLRAQRLANRRKRGVFAKCGGRSHAPLRRR